MDFVQRQDDKYKRESSNKMKIDLRQELLTQVQGTIRITSEEYKNFLKLFAR